MRESGLSESESVEAASSEENSENETAEGDNCVGKPVEYERERLKRIEENKKRMEALGLHKMASSVMGSFQRSHEQNKGNKGKKKMVDEDEEYNPDDEVRSSSGEDDEEFSGSRKKKVKKTSLTSTKHSSSQKPMLDLDVIDDDDDDDDLLNQAIALSLQDSAGFLDVNSSFLPQHSHVQHKEIPTAKTLETHLSDAPSDKKNENYNFKGDSGNRKRKKPVANRIVMSEDEVLIHFFQFDESGKGGFTLRDLNRMVDAHNFTWSEKEKADMIHCFDSNGDGKISFDDFNKIVCQCNMLKGSDNVTARK